MEKADPDLAFAWPVNLLDPALRSLASSQLLWLWRATDVANVDLDDGSECRARSGGSAGRRRRRGGMRGCVLRHARSIGANESGSNFATGWAVGWAVCPATTCKLLKELVGASGFEPPASWSRTRRSTRLSHAPNSTSVTLCACYTSARHLYHRIRDRDREICASCRPCMRSLERLLRPRRRFPRHRSWSPKSGGALDQARARSPRGRGQRPSIEARARASPRGAGPAIAAARDQCHRRGAAHQPGPRAARALRIRSPGYSNLEYDLATGRRGKRDVHTGRACWNACSARPASPSTTTPPPFSWR